MMHFFMHTNRQRKVSLPVITSTPAIAPQRGRQPGLLLLAAACLLAAAGCTRSTTAPHAYASTVDLLERKYTVDFGRDRDVVRYADYSKLIDQMAEADPESPWLAVWVGAMVTADDKGTRVQITRYDTAQLQFTEGERLRISVWPAGEGSTCVQARRTFWLTAPFSRAPRRYLQQFEQELAAQEPLLIYRRTPLKNYGALLRHGIKASRSGKSGS